MIIAKKKDEHVTVSIGNFDESEVVDLSQLNQGDLIELEGVTYKYIKHTEQMPGMTILTVGPNE